MKKLGDHYEYNIKQWSLDSAIAANKKGTPASKIVDDAKKFHAFILSERGELLLLNKEKKSNQTSEESQHHE